MTARLVTAGVAIPLFLVALAQGNAVWFVFLIVVGILGTYESCRLATVANVTPLPVASQLIASFFLVTAYISTGDGGGAGSLQLPWFAAGAAFIAAAHGLSVRVERQGLAAAGATLAAGLYPGVFLAQLLLLRDAGLVWAGFAVGVTWGTDTLAYFVGRFFGRRPLSPQISPNKTVEGAVGGLVAGMAIGLATGLWVVQSHVALWAAAGGLASIAGQLGDLVESGLKRRAGVKDSGRILPGHGGVLDRFDSLFFVATAVYYMRIFLE